MTTDLDFNVLADLIREKIIFEGLELQNEGIVIDNVKNETLLFDSNGLGLDSISGLELLASVQREFGIKLNNVNQQFIEENFSTIKNIANLVIEVRSSDNKNSG